MVVILYRLWLYLLVGFVIFLLSVILCVLSEGDCCLSFGWGTLDMALVPQFCMGLAITDMNPCGYRVYII